MKVITAGAIALVASLVSSHAAATPAATLTVTKQCDDRGSGWCDRHQDRQFGLVAFFDYSARAEAAQQGVDTSVDFALMSGESRSFFGLPFDTAVRVEEPQIDARIWNLTDLGIAGTFGTNQCTADIPQIACTGSPDFWNIEFTFVNSPVPAPAPFAILGIGLVGVSLLRKMQRP